MNIWRRLNPSKFINLSRVGGQSGFLFETKESRSSSIEEKWKRQFACWFDSNHLRQSDDEVGPRQWKNFHFEGTQLRLNLRLNFELKALSWLNWVKQLLNQRRVYKPDNCLLNEFFDKSIREMLGTDARNGESLVRAQDFVKRLHWSVEHFRPLKCRACLLGSGCRFNIVVFKLRSDLKISQSS